MADGMAWQIDAVVCALESADPMPPVTPVLCFLEAADWPVFGAPTSSAACGWRATAR